MSNNTAISRIAPRAHGRFIDRVRRRGRRLVLLAGLTALAAFWVYPFLWMISTSLKTNAEVFRGLSLVPQSGAQFQNYVRAWTAARFGIYFQNTVIVAAAVVVSVLLITSMAGYALGRRKAPGYKVILGLLVGTLLVPNSFTVIPIFDLMRSLGLLNTIAAVILAQVGTVPVIFILLFMGFFRSIPQEMEDSGVMDGAGFARVYRSIMLPMTGPVVATVVIFQFMHSWNDFLFPLVFTLGRPEARTLAVGMFAFVGEHMIDWAGMAAAASIALVPIMVLFIFMQKHFVRGLEGAVKG